MIVQFSFLEEEEKTQYTNEDTVSVFFLYALFKYNSAKGGVLKYYQKLNTKPCTRNQNIIKNTK